MSDAVVVQERSKETAKSKKKGPLNPVVNVTKKEIQVGSKIKYFEIREFKNGVKKSYFVGSKKVGVAKRIQKQRQTPL